MNMIFPSIWHIEQYVVSSLTRLIHGFPVGSRTLMLWTVQHGYIFCGRHHTNMFAILQRFRSICFFFLSFCTAQALFLCERDESLNCMDNFCIPVSFTFTFVGKVMQCRLTAHDTTWGLPSWKYPECSAQLWDHPGVSKCGHEWLHKLWEMWHPFTMSTVSAGLRRPTPAQGSVRAFCTLSSPDQKQINLNRCYLNRTTCFVHLSQNFLDVVIPCHEYSDTIAQLGLQWGVCNTCGNTVKTNI